MMAPLLPFLVLLIVAVVLANTPMDGTLKRVCMIVTGIIGLIMLLQFVKLV